MTGYTVAYQAYHGLRKATGISKAFQLFARRREPVTQQLRAAA
jgi:hypothetical protein